MKKVGIWIDHRRAVVVEIVDGVESQRVIESEIEPVPPASGGKRTGTPWAPRTGVKENGRKEHHQHQLAAFYRDVATQVGHPDHLLVMGPATAKNEFAEIAQTLHELAGVPMKIEAADKMTDPQIAAKVREYVFK
ncbi:MAG TPA: hypothetical protein VFX92_03270 [Candidatus Krumholzibacteria bacterium]|nr:hypothetical protein [Candidatus Krumholzibacteria bacterium]